MKTTNHTILAVLLLATGLGVPQLRAQEPEKDLADLDLDDLARVMITTVNPIGIGHTHYAGEWMIGYRYHDMHMEGSRIGTTPVSTATVMGTFPIVPLSMEMHMSSVNVMYGVSDRITLMVMPMYKSIEMDHLGPLGRFTTRSSGPGDLGTKSLISMLQTERHQLILGAGIRLPTGSIDERDNTPLGNVLLPYPMQLGSGTFDLTLDLTHTAEYGKWYWGERVGGLFRPGRNSRGYALGDRFFAEVWLTRHWVDWTGTTALLRADVWGNISGADSALAPATVQTANANRQGGTRAKVIVQQYFYVPRGRFEGNRFSGGFGIPFYQNLSGPQLELDWEFWAQWQFWF